MNAHQKKAVNRLLAQNGLGQLSDPGLIPQIGFLMGRACTTHEHFRDMLNKCEPAERLNMYEAMRPYLRFEAKPLDVYIAEIKLDAEIKQLPTVQPDGSLKPFQTAEIITDPIAAAAAEAERDRKAAELAQANRILAQTVTSKALWLVCARCTKEATFHGVYKSECVDLARAAGWHYSDTEAVELCPNCR